MKRMIYVLLLLAVLLTGCGGETVGMKAASGKRADGSSYLRYDGTEQSFFQVEPGRAEVVEITVRREAGKLRLVIHAADDPDRVVYEGHSFPADRFTVRVSEPGEYRILVEADGFEGSYQLRCSIES